MRRRSLCLLLAVTLGLLVAGCTPEVPRSLVVPLRDDARRNDVEVMLRTLREDRRVSEVSYGTLNAHPTQEQASAYGTVTAAGPDGNPWHEQSIELTVAPGISYADFESLVELIEAQRAFKRSQDDAEWWGQ